MKHLARKPLLLGLLAVWLFAAQIFGLIHQYSSSQHNGQDFCVTCAVSGANGAALPTVVVTVPITATVDVPVVLIVFAPVTTWRARPSARGPPDTFIA